MSIKLILAFVLVGLVCYLLGRASGRRSGRVGEPMIRDASSAPRTFDAPRAVSAATAHGGALDANTLEEIKRLIREGQLIGAIKIYRDRTNCGLREAKDGVESIMKTL